MNCLEAYTNSLLLDIETAPNKAYAWGLWDQNIAINQVIESGYMLSYSAQWLGDSEIVYHDRRESGMLDGIHKLLNSADIVIHYNGSKFDIPTLRKEFIKAKMPPPSPFKQLDLMQVVKRTFRFESNKLDYVCQALGIGGKARHQGFELWVGCMEGDERCWRIMERYNRQDVRLLNRLYGRLLPWIEKHPNHSAFADDFCCPKCGSKKFQLRGTQVAVLRSYQRYQCQSCGGWFRDNGTKRTRGVNIVE